MSVPSANLFNTIYDLNELGYKVYTDRVDEWYKVYIGPFQTSEEAEHSLVTIQKNIAKDAYIINETKTIPKQEDKLSERVTKQNNILKSVDNFGIGLQSYYYSNTFEKNGGYDFALEGYKHGISFMGTKTIGDFFYLHGDIRYTFADITYKDSSGYEQGVSETMYEARLLVGAEFIIDKHLLSPFIGLGYRTLYNDFKTIDGTTHISKYTYIPVGATHRYALGSKARISTTLEYDYFITGEVKNDNATYKQNDAYGFRVSTAYEKRELALSLFFIYVDIAKSETQTYSTTSTIYTNWIKKNNTKELGFEIKYFFN